MPELMALSAVVLLVYATIAFGAAAALRRNDLADVAWGLGFPVVALAAVLYAQPPWEVAMLGLGMTGLWGIRLAWYIGQRVLGHGEDFRYAQWRREWGSTWLWRSYLQVFLLQGFFLWVVSLPVLGIIGNLERVAAVSWAGLAVWMIGLTLESVADAQMRRFKANPENSGHIIASGLWRYSRHPNYFGEVLLWWGVWLAAMGNLQNWWTALGPATLTFLILKVSGIPMLEKKYAGRPDWEAYKARTSAFIPLPPKA